MAHRCKDCDRSFGKGAALADHRRVAHPGAPARGRTPRPTAAAVAGAARDVEARAPEARAVMADRSLMDLAVRKAVVMGADPGRAAAVARAMSASARRG